MILIIVLFVMTGCTREAVITAETMEAVDELSKEPVNTVNRADVIEAFQKAGYQIMSRYENLTLHEMSQGMDEVYTLFISLGFDASRAAVIVFLDDGRMLLRSMIADQSHDQVAFADLTGDGICEIIFQPVAYGADNDGGSVYVFSAKENTLEDLFVVAYGNTDQYLDEEYKQSFFFITDENSVLRDDQYDDYTGFISGLEVIREDPALLCIDHTVGLPTLGHPYTTIGWNGAPVIVEQGFK